ncbi:MAG: AMP-binding protein [Parvularculaceae bacterium]
MSDGNFYALLRSRFAARLDTPCLTLPDGRTLSYGDIDAMAARTADVLRNTSAKPGDRVMAQVDKSPENVALYLGALRAGLVYVPLNTSYTAEEVGHFLNDARPVVFVCRPESEATLASLAKASGVKSIFTLDAAGSGSLSEADAALREGIEPRGRDDLAAILYTSGTTGRSKGAMLTHGALAANALALHKAWGFRPGDALLHALPIFHIHGLFVALHTAMLNASEILFLPKFDVAEIRKKMKRATVMMGVPTFYTRLLADPDFSRADCAHMRLFISGSAPLTEQVWEAFRMRTGHEILERYGMSEAGMIASNPLHGARVPGTVGFALPGVEIRITGADGAPLLAGETGAVEVKGASLFAGYWNMPEKAAAEFHDGWFVTGDLGALDAEGRLTLSGRAKDLIIAGGYNIYPKEIEIVLDAVPGVNESAVIGVPHPDMGEGVVAVLVPEGGSPDAAAVSEEDIAAALQSLARFKRPRKFFWVEALPRNAMGKVQKQSLREMYKDAFLK